MEYPVDYKCETLRIQKFDKDHDHDVEYTYINAFPRSIAPVTVSYDQSRLLELSVTFTYDRHFFGGLDRLSRAYRSGQISKFNDPFRFVNSTGNRADSPIALPPNATSEQVFAVYSEQEAASVTENESTVTYYNTGDKAK